jgi:hypothetical protein
MTIEELKNALGGASSQTGQAIGGQMPQQHYGVCPACGHCPHCGRGGHQFQSYPYYRTPWITWGGNGTVIC